MLKELLGDKWKDGMTVEEAETALTGKNLADLSTGEYVSKGKYADALKDVETKNGTIAEQLRQLEELKKTSGASEQLKAEIDKLKKAITDKENEFSQKYNARERQYIIDDSLKGAKAKNLGALKGALNGKFDFDKAEIKDGKITGLDDVLNELKTSDGYLFDDGVPTIPKAGKEHGGAGNGGSDVYAELRKL